MAGNTSLKILEKMLAGFQVVWFSLRMSNTNHAMIKITNELDIISPIAIKRPGLRLITHRTLTDGAYIYAGTDKAMEWLKANFDCQYENGNGEWVKAA
jgi:hypothetical protein